MYVLYYITTHPMLTLLQLRDAELIPQVLSLAREKMALDDVRWEDVFADAVAEVVVGAVRGRGTEC